MLPAGSLTVAETRAGELQCNALGWVRKDAEPAGRRQEGYYASRNGQTRENDTWQCYKTRFPNAEWMKNNGEKRDF
jgi:hypothetical protein